MITCALWDVESRELDRGPRGPGNVAFYLIRGTLYPTGHNPYGNGSATD